MYLTTTNVSYWTLNALRDDLVLDDFRGETPSLQPGESLPTMIGCVIEGTMHSILSLFTSHNSKYPRIS